MDQALKTELFTAVDAAVKANLASIVGDEVAERVEKAVRAARIDAALNGGALGADEKMAFVSDLRSISRNEKSAYLGVNDQTGGYLIPTEVHGEIMRIAATVGLAARDCRSFPMGTDELELPVYTGAALQGNFQGENTEGDETQNDIGVSVLRAKYWQVLLRFSNILLADSSVAVADWVLSLVAEGLAYRMDREVFQGGTFAGSPFIGLLATNSGATVQTMTTGKDTFAEFDIVEASDAIGAVETAALADAGFYFHPTVWAKVRAQSTSGIFVFGQSNLAALKRPSGLQPVGQILDFPVFTTPVLPANSATAVSTKFGVFANLKLAMAIGDRGPMEIAKSTEATVGGKNLFTSNQTAYRVSKRWSVAQMLPAAAVVLKTAAS